MSNFVFGSNLSYSDYIQAQSFVDDIKSSNNRIALEISKQTRQLIASKETLSQMDITTRENIANRISNQLSEGFETLSYQMQDISAGINELNSTFHWGFSRIISVMGGMNDSIKELIRIAKTPAQTAALEHFEIARDMFRKRIYSDVLEELGKAINGVPGVSAGYKQEWRVHQLEGIVKLGFVGCKSELINLEEAEVSFLKAAMYAEADNPQDSANAYLAAGWTAYCQGKIRDSIINTKKCLDINPKIGEAIFLLSKALIAEGRIEKSFEVLRRAINQDLFYAIKASADGDFQKYEEDLRRFFSSLVDEYYNNIGNTIAEYKDKYQSELSDIDNIFSSVVIQKTILDYPNSVERLKKCEELIKAHHLRFYKISQFINSIIESDFLDSVDELIDNYNNSLGCSIEKPDINRHVSNLNMTFNKKSLNSIKECSEISRKLTEEIDSKLKNIKWALKKYYNTDDEYKKLPKLKEKVDKHSELSPTGCATAGIIVGIVAAVSVIITLFGSFMNFFGDPEAQGIKSFGSSILSWGIGIGIAIVVIYYGSKLMQKQSAKSNYNELSESVKFNQSQLSEQTRYVDELIERLNKLS
jgi:tetratricopeptide (TPR) repeat protein